MTKFTLVCAPPGSGKSAEMQKRYVDWLKNGGDPKAADKVLFLVPSAEHRRQTMLALLDNGLPGLYDPRLFTFSSLAQAVLEANHAPARELSPAQRELLIADIVKQLYPDGVAGKLGQVANLPGFVAGLGRLVEELKQGLVAADKWPNIADSVGLKDHPVTKVLHDVYSAYQARLKEVGLHDEPGLLWALHDLLSGGLQKPVEGLKLLLVDGFDEFTHAQLDILQLLADGAEEVVVSLCLDPDGEAFALTQATKKWLLSSWPQPPQDIWLEGPSDVPDEKVTIIGAPGPLAETREVARMIKSRLLADGSGNPEEHAVVVRSLDAYETPLRQVFGEYGVPLELPRGPLLGQSPAVQAVLDVLQVFEGDFRRDDVVHLLNSNYVDEAKLQEGTGTPLLSAEVFERVAREARVIGGSDQWVQQLALLNKRLQDQKLLAKQGLTENAEGDPIKDDSAIAQALQRTEQAQSLLTKLQAVLEPLQKADSPIAAVQALTKVLEALGVLERVHSWPASGPPQALDRQLIARDRAALLRLLALLRQYGEATQVLHTNSATDEQPAWKDLQAFLSAVAATERLPREADWGGAVRVLSANQVAGHRFRHVYVLGLREGDFPRHLGPDAFFDEAARQSLQCKGQPVLTTRERQRAREAMYFRRTLAAAEETLTLTWPTSDASGNQQLRSSFLDDLLEQHPEWAKQEKLVNWSAVIPSPGDAADHQELLAAVCQAAEPTTLDALLSGLLDPGTLDSLLARIKIENQRQSQHAPDAYDGVLGDGKIQSLLAESLFGPTHHFSASQFDTYAQCPMRFFLQRVLRLDELEDPNEDLQAKDLGSLMHRVLANFFKQRPADKQTVPLTASDLETEKAQMKHCLDEVWKETETLGMLPHKALAKVLYDQVFDDLKAILCYKVELQQGKGKEPKQYVSDCELPYETHLADDDLLVVGRIDRVDQVIGQGVKVYDYKSSDGPSETVVKKGLATQLPLYVRGLKAVDKYSNAVVEGCGYYRIRGKAHVKEVPSKSDLDTVVESCLEAIKANVKHLRGGHFAPLPAECPNYCAYRAICRYSRTRMNAKAAVSEPADPSSPEGSESND